MTDDTTDDTTLAQRVDQLEARLDEQQDYQQQVQGLIDQFASGNISRRAFLTALAAAGAGGYLLSHSVGIARADPEWQNATGDIGTEQTPLANGWVQNFHSQSFSTSKIDSKGGYTSVGGSRTPNTWYQNTTGSDLEVIVIMNCDNSGSNQYDFVLDVNDSQNNKQADRRKSTQEQTDLITLQATVPTDYYYKLRVIDNGGGTSLNDWLEQT